jgi:acyl-coenzyme A thioesterase PaaI-like protein
MKEDEGKLSLALKKSVCNHVETIHAAAQFTLAETESGMRLQSLFPELEQKVIPLLREAQIKYKKPATQKIIAYSFVEEADVEKFKQQFAKKGRALLQIRVEIRDIEDVLTCEARYTWYVQARSI